MNINEKIRAARIDKGWTQKRLAEALSVSESTVQKWESQKNDISSEYLLPLSHIFNFTVEQLLDNTKDIIFSREIIELYREEQEEHPKDSSPHIVYDANLKAGGKLHRFDNNKGVPYSAIYVGSYESYSCERIYEQQMLQYWNDHHLV